VKTGELRRYGSSAGIVSTNQYALADISRGIVVIGGMSDLLFLENDTGTWKGFNPGLPHQNFLFAGDLRQIAGLKDKLLLYNSQLLLCDLKSNTWTRIADPPSLDRLAAFVPWPVTGRETSGSPVMPVCTTLIQTPGKYEANGFLFLRRFKPPKNLGTPDRCSLTSRTLSSSMKSGKSWSFAGDCWKPENRHESAEFVRPGQSSVRRNFVGGSGRRFSVGVYEGIHAPIIVSSGQPKLGGRILHNEHGRAFDPGMRWWETMAGNAIGGKFCDSGN